MIAAPSVKAAALLVVPSNIEGLIARSRSGCRAPDRHCGGKPSQQAIGRAFSQPPSFVVTKLDVSAPSALSISPRLVLMPSAFALGEASVHPPQVLMSLT